MTTPFFKTVRRRTTKRFRIAICGPVESAAGRRLIVELTQVGDVDLIRIREEGRRIWMELDPAVLYWKATIAQAAIARAAKRKGRK